MAQQNRGGSGIETTNMESSKSQEVIDTNREVLRKEQENQGLGSAERGNNSNMEIEAINNNSDVEFENNANEDLGVSFGA